MIVFFFNDTATTEIYTLSLHDALPILREAGAPAHEDARQAPPERQRRDRDEPERERALDVERLADDVRAGEDRKSTRLNSSHANISYAVFCLKKNNRLSSGRRAFLQHP